MSTAIYPFGIDHDDRDRGRVRADLGAAGGAWRDEVRVRFRFLRRRHAVDD